MDTSVTGVSTWQVIHHLCEKHDTTIHTPCQGKLLSQYIQSLQYVFSCIYCRNSLKIFLKEMHHQLNTGITNRQMRRFAYDLHNRVNEKLFRQENERVDRCLKQHLPQLLNDPEGESKVWESIRHELSCILYTQLAPPFDVFIKTPRPRNEEESWKSLFYGCHGHTLNKEPVNEQYKLFIESTIGLYWPSIIGQREHKEAIGQIIDNNDKTFLRRAWEIRLYIHELQKAKQISKMKKILCQDPVYVDKLRDLQCFSQHKHKFGQSFEEVETEMKFLESHCKEKTCRKTAIF